jgi:hypothetical protein
VVIEVEVKVEVGAGAGMNVDMHMDGHGVVSVFERKLARVSFLDSCGPDRTR